jgi:hemerythrin superfamily protein
MGLQRSVFRILTGRRSRNPWSSLIMAGVLWHLGLKFIPVKKQSESDKKGKMGLFTSRPVLEMLKEDHAKVRELFDRFQEEKNARTKRQIVQETIHELEVHAKLEETLIYPTIRNHMDDDDVMDEALEEHHIAHVLINELKRMRLSDERYDAKFTVLGESIKHHVKEEEGTMFPKAEKADLDWEELHEEAIKRKEALLAQENNDKQRSKGQKKAPGRKSSVRYGREAA